MIPALTALLTFQLAGEVIARALALPLPGPVLGMVMLVAAMSAFPRLGAMIRPASQTILGNLSLLFVPAGVGVVGHLDTFGREGLGLIAALFVSTILAIAAGALTFSYVLKLTDRGAERRDG